MDHIKLDVLKQIARDLNEHNITWTLGGSCMLFLRGIVKDFNDIDIIVSSEDIGKIKSMVNAYKPYVIKKPNAHFATNYMVQLSINTVSIDLMVGFAIISKDIEYTFPLSNEDRSDYYRLHDVKVPLADLSTWSRMYQLMERYDKMQLIDEYMRRNQ